MVKALVDILHGTKEGESVVIKAGEDFPVDEVTPETYSAMIEAGQLEGETK